MSLNLFPGNKFYVITRLKTLLLGGSSKFLVRHSMTQFLLKRTFEIFVKALYCWFNESYITNTTCKLRAIRGKNGICNLGGRALNPINKLKGLIITDYHYTAGYRPWVLKIEVDDICEFVNKKPEELNIFQRTLWFYLKSALPSILHPCPYAGYESAFDIDVDAHLPEILPPSLPKGQYKFRNYLKFPNGTRLLELNVTIVIKPLRAFVLNTDFEMGR